MHWSLICRPHPTCCQGVGGFWVSTAAVQDRLDNRWRFAGGMVRGVAQKGEAQHQEPVCLVSSGAIGESDGWNSD